MSPRAKKSLQALLSVGFLVAIFWFVLKQFADLSEVWTAIQTLTRWEVAALAAATLWNLVTYWLVVVIATPGLTLVQAGVLTQSTTAVANAVPAGGAIAVGLTYTIMSSWGFSKSRSTLSIIVTGIWNNFVKLGTWHSHPGACHPCAARRSKWRKVGCRCGWLRRAAGRNSVVCAHPQE